MRRIAQVKTLASNYDVNVVSAMELYATRDHYNYAYRDKPASKVLIAKAEDVYVVGSR